MNNHFALVLATICAASLQPFVVQNAQAETDKERANVLFIEGNGLFKRGMTLEALARYRAARRIYPSFKIDLNIGSCLGALGRRAEAAEFFERFLAQSANTSAALVAAARRRLESLRSRLAAVTITSLVDGALVSVDGRRRGKTPLDLRIYLEPGRHMVRVTRPGYRAFKAELILKSGEHRTVDDQLKVLDAAPAPSTVAAKQMSEREAEWRRGHQVKTVSGYAAVCGGASLLLSAAVVYGVFGARGKAAHEAYTAATVPAEIEAHWQDQLTAEAALVAAHVVAGAGAATLGIGLYQLLTRSDLEARPAKAVSLDVAGITPLVGGAALSIRGGF